MPRTKAQISGIALLIGMTGVTLVISGITGVPWPDLIRRIVKGDLPSGSAAAAGPTGAPTLSQTTDLGQAVANTGLDYLGVPYRFGGHTPDGWDCSGFVTYVLRQNGLNLPNNTHTRAIQYYTWSGAYTIPRAACAPGDLVCWVSHIGIAINRDEMVNSPRPGKVTEIAKIYNVPAPIIRRPKAYELRSGKVLP